MNTHFYSDPCFYIWATQKTRKAHPAVPQSDSPTDSSSDSASHTHSARRPSATALLTRSRGGGLTPPPSTRKLQKLCVGRWGAVSLWMCVLSSALICNALAWRCSHRRDKDQHGGQRDEYAYYASLFRSVVLYMVDEPPSSNDSSESAPSCAPVRLT